MGQMTYAVMLGVEWEADAMVLADAVGDFKVGRGPEVQSPGPESDIIGIFVAGGENSGAPALLGGFVLNRFEMTKPYAKRCEQAERQWSRFHAHCAKRDVTLPVATYYLVETEDA